MSQIRIPVEEEPIKIENKDGDSNGSEIAHLNPLLVDLQIVEATPPNHLRSPILSRLPPEIISHIFELTLLEFSIFSAFPTKSSPPPKMDQTTTPFNFGAVCKYWRAITWSTPVLWSSMVVHFSKFTVNNNRSTLVRDWLSRSGQLPLSIRIFIQPFKMIPVVSEADLNFLAGIVSQYSSRWRHFELSAPYKIARFFRAEGSHAPILESLGLNVTGPSRRYKLDLITCPRLQRVHLGSVQLSLINFSWNNVRHICMHSMSLESCLEILRKTPLLVHAEVVGEDGFSHAFGEIITPLKSLKVVVEFNWPLFHCITCPALEELIFDLQGMNHHVGTLIPFLRRSGPLRSFSMLDILPTKNPLLIDILRAMPSLNKLVLSQAWSVMKAENILELLVMIQSSQSNPSQPRFLPHLETLEYTGPYNFAYVDLDSLPAADDSIQRPLRLIKLDFRSPITRISRKFTHFLLGLVERGVTVNICSQSQDILQSSVNYYRNKEESLRRDWIDDLDLSLIQDLS